jgi:1-acyl-sn-glycerol-3-phosphate acyltransferase
MEVLGFEKMSKRPTTSKRLLIAIGADVKLATGEIQTHGEEHLKEIPPDKKVIIATTHISDLDVPIATLKLGKYFDIAITNQSIHHSFLGAPSMIWIMGTGYFFIERSIRAVLKAPRAEEFHEDNRAATPTTSLTAAMAAPRFSTNHKITKPSYLC